MPASANERPTSLGMSMNNSFLRAARLPRAASLPCAAFILRAALLTAATAAASFAAAPLPAEHLSVAKLKPSNPHRLYVLDEAFFNEIDSRVHLFDGDTYERLGQIDTGFNPGLNLSPDGKTIVATTYYARGSRGARTDVVEFWDNATLSTAHEIVLPAKRAMTLPTYFNVGYSADSRFVYVSYVTPAASFGVLDPAKNSVVEEIDTAGCVLVIPSGPNRVSSICESGRLLTVTLDSEGHEASRAESEPFFNPDEDPVFAQGIPMQDGYVFLSFLGDVHEVDFSGPAPVIHKSWSLVSAAEKGHWRTGGMQVGAIHRKLDRLYVPMHVGGEGSHKDGGSEIWVFDLKTHQRMARWPVAQAKLAPVISVQVSQDEAPILFAATEGSDLAVFDAVTGRVRHVEKRLGQSAWFLMTP
jgi:methylamine dehydrogenase heavy chain